MTARPTPTTQSAPNLVRLDDGRVATRSLVPGAAAYGEIVLRVGPDELRVMNPQRNKLAAMIVKGARTIPFEPRTNVLYLGAANGATVSHVSDLVPDGTVVAVEFSPRAFRDLLRVARDRPNVVPVLADASQPRRYAALVDRVDTLYMDVSQRDQAGIFLRNWRAFSPRVGILMVKARSVDVGAKPSDVYAATRAQIEREARVLETIPLDPFEADHAALVVGGR